MILPDLETWHIPWTEELVQQRAKNEVGSRRVSFEGCTKHHQFGGTFSDLSQTQKKMIANKTPSLSEDSGSGISLPPYRGLKTTIIVMLLESGNYKAHS